MALEQKAAWYSPGSTPRDPGVTSSALLRVCREPDTAVRKRVFVVGDVSGPGHYHLGDEAMFEANLARLRELIPGVSFTVLSGDPEWSAQAHGVKALPFPHIPSGHTPGSWWQQAVNAPDRSAFFAAWLGSEICASLDQSSGLVISGGGNLCSTWPDKILERLALCDYAHRHDIPVVVVGQTIGPTLSADQREMLSSCLRRCEWVGVREGDSAALVSRMGVRSDRINKQLDDAFFLEPVPVIDDQASELQAGELFIVVSLDASFQGEAQKGALIAIANQLDSMACLTKAKLVFLPNVGGEDVDPALADDKAGQTLAAHLDSHLIDMGLLRPGEARWLIGQAALVVSTRYHPIVFATAAAVPSIAIYTNEYTRTKLRGALTPSELEAWCVPVSEAERGSLLPLLMELWERRETVAEQLKRSASLAWNLETERWDGICRALRVMPNAVGRLTPPLLPARPQPSKLESRNNFMPAIISEEQWDEYQQKGYLRLGKLLSDPELLALQERLDGIMLGTIRYPSVQMQLDTGGKYEELPEPVARHLEPTLAYRKLQGLEADPSILELIRRDIFREICAWHYGKHASISIFRVMMMNKPASKGTYLPWHQDAGDVWKLDRDPMVTTWIALDPATKANGCVQVIPGTHKLGLLSKNGSNISSEHERLYCPQEKIEYLELEPGEGLLLHNWLLHRSDVNRTAIPRRALSACYMDGRTLNVLNGTRFPIVFGEHEDIDIALPFIRNVKAENRALHEMATDAQNYAQSLVEEVQRREAMQQEAVTYAQSLLDDSQRREQMRLESERYAQALEAELLQLRGTAMSATSS